jgi:trans-aconitate 2-methyltransferase
MSVQQVNIGSSLIYPRVDIWDGKKYHSNSGQQQMVADLLMKQYPFQDSDEILDVGCGAGDVTACLAQKVSKGSVIGVDPSSSMIESANENFNRGRLRFELGKASELPYDQQFDVVTSFSALHWEPKQREALMCFKKALKPGGAIVLAIPGPDPILRIALEDIKRSSQWEDFLKDFVSPGKIWTANEYAQLLLDTGFQIKKIEVVERPYAFENEKGYKGFVEAMLPHLTCIPEKFVQEFLDDLVGKVKQTANAINEFGHLKFEVNVLEVIAYR